MLGVASWASCRLGSGTSTVHRCRWSWWGLWGGAGEDRWVCMSRSGDGPSEICIYRLYESRGLCPRLLAEVGPPLGRGNSMAGGIQSIARSGRSYNDSKSCLSLCSRTSDKNRNTSSIFCFPRAATVSPTFATRPISRALPQPRAKTKISLAACESRRGPHTNPATTTLAFAALPQPPAALCLGPRNRDVAPSVCSAYL